ncbi:unnamed protein product [Arctia plantaginis]|uniref:Uncharacterized protein n=1 Tax=Arctia plantaginis TaxID=874455 RepID=A0A8S0Z5C8_ARCPL|nr:unnamed protein product [Arctia plantaginis]
MPFQTTLARWLSTELPEDGHICHPCFLLLSSEDASARVLGHTMVCLGCGRSVRDARHHIVESESPLLLDFSFTTRLQGITRNYICHPCWMRSNRQLHHDSSREETAQSSDNIQHEDALIPVQPEPPNLPLSHVLPPTHRDLPDYTTIKNKLKEHFQNDIEYHLMKRDMILLYKNGTACKKLCKDRYEKTLKSKEDERTRIVEMAAEIVLEDIRSKVYDMNYYETLDINEGNLFKDVPETLQVFFNVVCKSNKEKSKNNVRRMDKKVAKMSHCIITSVRPRSLLSPILLGLSSMIYKKYASKGLIDSLSNLDSYVQFVYDNADHNTCTIDGKNIFHAMGGIMVVTPASSVTSKKSISRLKQIPSSEEIGDFGFVKLKHFENKNSDGLRTVQIEDVLDVTDNYEISSADFTWSYSKFANNKSDG